MEQLGRYLLEKKLAQGGMAEVFLARQRGPNGVEKVCVVKRMLPGLSEDLTFIEMFLDEARLAARLSHAGIAQILDFGHESNTFYLALEYVAGQNLKQVLEARLARKKKVPLPVAARLVSLVAQALDYAHHAVDEKGRPLDLIHRDVSPQNVMVGANGEVKLIDFGIAKAATDSHRTVAGTLKGKYAYMSPEQLRTSKIDQRTDIYALGLVLYELITLHPAVPPNENMNALLMAAAQRKYAPIDQFRPETPAPLRRVLDKALALEPKDRFQKARDMAAALEEYLTSSGSRVKPADLAALVIDQASITTDPEARQVATPAPHDWGELPPTAMHEPETLRDEPPPPGLRRQVRSALETVASRKSPGQGAPSQDSTPITGTPGVDDPSLQPTPIVGTPAVARRAVEPPPPAPDQSLMPTDPVRNAPDIAAAMKRPSKGSSKPQPALKAKDEVPPPAASPQPPMPFKTMMTPAPVTTGIIAPPEKPARAPRRWPWLLLILVLLPIGAVASVLAFLPESSPLRARVVQVVGPVLQKLKR
ncbi:MAG: protein kinase [Myxococcaceae bacterium]|nr:protein kinase [Myxococcaceae bacterium]